MRKPTRGNMVDYYHNENDEKAANNSAEACPAVVTAVNSPESLNLFVLPDATDKALARTSVERGILEDDLLKKTKNPFWLFTEETERMKAALLVKGTRTKKK